MSAFDGADCIAGHRLFCTIIHVCIMVSYDVHNHGTRCHNFQPTVFHIERHIKVVVAVGELVGGKAHVIEAHKRSRRCRSARTRDIRHIVQRTVGVHRIAAHRPFCVIILLEGGITRDNHLHILLVDGQITIGHVEHHIGERAVGVREVISIKFHRVSVDIRARCRGGSVEREVGCGVGLRALRHPDVNDIKTAYAVFACVIIHHQGAALDRHNHRAGRHNLQPTVGNDVKGDVKIAIGVREG